MSEKLVVSIALETLKVDEGFRERPYPCTANKMTIGYGRNLDDTGISKKELLYLFKERGLTKKEAEYLLVNDTLGAEAELLKAFPFINEFTYRQQAVLINMCVNIGINRLKGFKRMWAALEEKNFVRAALEMLDSRWAGQVGDRAIRLAHDMKEG